MQWDNSLHGGFTTGTPWLAENPNYTKINVTDQMNRSDSVLSFYKELIALRKAPEYVEPSLTERLPLPYEDVDHMFAYYHAPTKKPDNAFWLPEISAQTPRHCRLKTG